MIGSMIKRSMHFSWPKDSWRVLHCHSFILVSWVIKFWNISKKIGLQYGSTGNHNQAAEFLRYANKIEPDNPLVLQELGTNAFYLDQYQSALDYFFQVWSTSACSFYLCFLVGHSNHRNKWMVRHEPQPWVLVKVGTATSQYWLDLSKTEKLRKVDWVSRKSTGR